MNHPGGQCRQLRRLAEVKSRIASEEPASAAQASEASSSGSAATPAPVKKQKVSSHDKPDVVEVPPSVDRQEPPMQGAARSAELSDQLVKESSKFRRSTQGTRGDPEPPTLVAKVCATEGSGEMWLCGLPISSTLPRFQQLGVAIQVSCFKSHPETLAHGAR